MSDLTYSISGNVQKGSLREQFNASAVTANIATAGVLSLTLGLGTTSQAITTTSLGAVGLAFIRNLSTVSTHEVLIGRVVSNTLHETVRLRGGEAAVTRLAAGSYAAKASVAGTTRAVITIYED
jgi:hypothetical protein